MLISTERLREYYEQSIAQYIASDERDKALAIKLALANLNGWELQEANRGLNPPYLCIYEKEKTAAVVCTPELFEYINKLEDIDETKEFSILGIGKLWMEVKKVLKQGISKQ